MAEAPEVMGAELILVAHSDAALRVHGGRAHTAASDIGPLNRALEETSAVPRSLFGPTESRIRARQQASPWPEPDLSVFYSVAVGDKEFGQNPGLCEYLERERLPYVMAIPKNTTFLDSIGVESKIEVYAQQLPRNAWQRRACGIGAKGHRVYDWALTGSAEPDLQYLIRRSITDGELAFYRCYNPHRAGFGELVSVAGARWPIEECFGSSKNETGLDNYQVRTWTAWHRHITFAMLAHTFLAVTAHQAKKGGAALSHPKPTHQHPSADA